MTTQETARVENPHRATPRDPLLRPHPVRPATLASGVALTGLGIVFGLHQAGTIQMGQAPTIAALVIAAAVCLAGIALGWARSASAGDRGPGGAEPSGASGT